MRLNSNVLIVVFALGLFSIGALAADSESLLGTNDQTAAVNDYEANLATSTFAGATVFNQTIGGPSEANPTRDRGITLDRARGDVYVAYSRPNEEDPFADAGDNVIQVFDTTGTLERRFLIANLEQTNDVYYDPLADRLFITNAYVYGSVVQASDDNVYVIDNVSAVADGSTVVAAVFSTRPGGVGEVFFNDIEIHPLDGQLYVVRQTASFGTGPGFVERFDATATAFYDSISIGSGAFGVAFDADGNMYYGLANDIFKQPFTGIDSNGFATFGAATALITGLSTSFVCDVYVSPDSGLLYAAGFTGTSVFMIDPDSGDLLDTVLGPQAGFPKTDFLVSFPAAQAVPTVSEGGLLFLALLLVACTFVALRK